MEEPAKFKLLVEGRDEEHVIKKLLTKNGLLENCKFVLRNGSPVKFEIVPKGGYENLRKSIKVELKGAGLEVMGIVADANDSINNRWKSIANQLNEFGFNVPTKFPGYNNTHFLYDGITVGIWLMPNNRDKGELEDLILKMIDQADPVLRRAKQYINEIPPEDRKFTDKKLNCAYLYAWLATRRKPNPIGTAMEAGDIDHSHPEARPFISWFRSLFSLQQT